MAFRAHIFSENLNCRHQVCKLLGCADVCDLIHRMCRVIAEVGEIVKSCSIIVKGR